MNFLTYECTHPICAQLFLRLNNNLGKFIFIILTSYKRLHLRKPNMTWFLVVCTLNLVPSPSCLKGSCNSSSNLNCGCFASLFFAILRFHWRPLLVISGFNSDMEISTPDGVCSNYIPCLRNKTIKTSIAILSFLFCPKSSSEFPLFCSVLSPKAFLLLRSSGLKKSLPDFKFAPGSRKRKATLCKASSNE